LNFFPFRIHAKKLCFLKYKSVFPRLRLQVQQQYSIDKAVKVFKRRLILIDFFTNKQGNEFAKLKRAQEFTDSVLRRQAKPTEKRPLTFTHFS